MNPNDFEKILVSIGATAEMSFLYYKSCLKAGATVPEAILLSKMFLEVMIEDTRLSRDTNQRDEQENDQ